MTLIPSTASLGTAAFQLVFWTLVFLLNVGPDWHQYSSAREVLEVVGTITVLQVMVAIVAVKFLVPGLLDKGKTGWFSVLLFALLLLAAELNILISYSYLESAYPQTYGAYYQTIDHLTLVERMGFSPILRYILLSKLPVFFFPAAVLIAVAYYRKQRQALQLRDQQRTAELKALKSQLNPHFIFNTLNNIYALAIQRSDQTAEAVARLSGILDYVLYRCNQTYVSLVDELAMLESYIALEMLRFGDRLTVSMDNQVDEAVYVAPLVFLTLIENAFKHGASQELHHASVDILLTTTPTAVIFQISNSKPSTLQASTDQAEKIGLKNLQRQLDLIYPNAHQLSIDESDSTFTVRAQLKKVVQ